ncbi:acyltransferase family protein [Pseudoclavibacter terrae]|uniref:acyltransferase family protein n=1 Tax=Pseudoclavibacter terrae TaxID=1530195 RepID=UPI002FE22BBE
MRALAVLAVFADHLLHWPSGGFVGVDIFFVLSGFLITGILLREIEETGRVSLVRFYLRRVKRLVPAALLVTLVSIALSRVIFYSDGASSVLQDGIWATLFVANWRFIRNGTDYFAMDGPTSPLQHYWSLSVEEQFYLVWPLLLIAASVIAVRLLRRTESLRLTALFIIGALTAVSFVWSLLQSDAEPVVAYFSTFTRAWELGAGAMLAITAPSFIKMGTRLRIALAYLGIACMVGAMLFITADLPFPGPWAVFPVVGAGLLIASGIGQEAPHLRAFTNPVATYIGNISYSLYLWHFPAIIFGSIAFAGLGAWAPLAIGVVAFGLASSAYHLVEQPVLRSPLFERSRRGQFLNDWGRWSRRWRVQAWRATIGALAVVAVAALVTSVTVQGAPADFSSTRSEDESIADLLDSSVTSRTLPAEVSAQIDAVAADAPATYFPASGCHNPAAQEDTDRCRFGSGPLHALVLGDSIAAATLPALAAALEPLGYRTTGMAFSSCAVSTAPLVWVSNPERERGCADFQSNLPLILDSEAPDLVIVLDSEIAYEGIATQGQTREDAWEEGREEALAEIAAVVPEIVLVHPNPRGTSLGDCANRLTASAASCLSPVSASWTEKTTIDERVAAEFGVSVVSTVDLFCSDARCPIYAGTTVQRFDEGHPTQSYLDLIQADLDQRVAAALG